MDIFYLPRNVWFSRECLEITSSLLKTEILHYKVTYLGMCWHFDLGDFLYCSWVVSNINLILIFDCCGCTQAFSMCSERGMGRYSLLRSWASPCRGFSCFGAQALGAWLSNGSKQAQWLQLVISGPQGSAVVALGLRYSMASGIFLDQGLNWSPFLCKADS